MGILFFIFGLIIGSFLNVVIIRIVKEESITGRSKCPSCHQLISWYDNIPILSFILLRGRCRRCQQKISWQYPVVELLSGLFWLWGYFYFSVGGSLFSAIVFGIFVSFLWCLFILDWRWYVLPDQITLPAIAVAVILNLFLGKSWLMMLVSALLGAAWFGCQYLISRGRWVGSGDIRLGALMGVMLVSWQALFTALFLAYITGALAAVILLVLKKKSWGSQLPFGTFLTAATVVTLLYGQQLWEWYGRLIGW